MKVEFTYNNGKKKVMAETFAKTLQRMKLGTYSTTAINQNLHRSMQPELFNAPASSTKSRANNQSRSRDDDDNEPLISDAVKKLADESGIDISTITGTGAKGRINKQDIELAIAAKTSAADSLPTVDPVASLISFASGFSHSSSDFSSSYSSSCSDSESYSSSDSSSSSSSSD
jgi:pyruvate/2-oxoglutarate dehydrogenase complex dihydrolipoamide acyltransferase (E2) component